MPRVPFRARLKEHALLWQRPEPSLTLPHPGLAERAFVLVPLAELCPALEVPGLGRVSTLLQRLQPVDLERLDALLELDEPGEQSLPLLRPDALHGVELRALAGTGAPGAHAGDGKTVGFVAKLLEELKGKGVGR
jgi:hypothetical protein